MRNGILVGVIVLAAGIAAWRVFSFHATDQMPDTADSKTTWMCYKCKDRFELTSKGIQDRLDKKEYEQKSKSVTFKCSKCNAFSVYRAEECPMHHQWYCIGREGEKGCTECAKIR